MQKLNYPVALATPEFLSTNILNETELADRLAYCFENFRTGGWRIFDCKGLEFVAELDSEERNARLVQLLTGRKKKYRFIFSIGAQLTMTEIGEILYHHLSQHTNWWWNNEEAVSTSRVKTVIAQSKTTKELFDNLGWFAPEVY